NLLIFAAGIATGRPVIGSGRNSAGAISPLTGGFGDAEAGGYWGTELEAAGYDVIVIAGQAAEPVYIFIHDREVSIRSAARCWGIPTVQAQELLREESGCREARVAQIGPGGENLVRYACIVNDLHHFYGRCGLGAVMGAKRLKAVVVRGSGSPAVHDTAALEKCWRQVLRRERKGFKSFGRLGTTSALEYFNEMGALPTRNFQKGTFEGAAAISGRRISHTILQARGTCASGIGRVCPIACKRVVGIADGPFPVDPRYGGPEYETLAALGSLCGVRELAMVAKANELCAGYGIDTISTGAAVAFAMECFEQGLLTTRHTGGMTLSFGDGAAMIEMIHRIARREGIGDLLAEGTKRASEQIPGSAGVAMEVKGQEIPMVEPRFRQGLGLGYMVSPTGADHNHNIHDSNYTEDGDKLWEARSMGIAAPLAENDLGHEKVRLFVYLTPWRYLLNCIGLCKFIPYRYEELPPIINAITGWETTLFELIKVGERAINLCRLVNIRRGFTPADDRLPARFFHDSGDGALRGIDEQAMQQAKHAYYLMMGWSPETGAPLPGTLLELGLDWAVSCLEPETDGETLCR
ncbi:aldehyde ferredoxin oxidoreductase family protein, partial [bacterium]|nr:aldehyde ferredoxin oxidoreductase family protein [candidate division CSSED10-310 bacterium]